MFLEPCRAGFYGMSGVEVFRVSNPERSKF